MQTIRAVNLMRADTTFLKAAGTSEEDSRADAVSCVHGHRLYGELKRLDAHSLCESADRANFALSEATHNNR